MFSILLSPKVQWTIFCGLLCIALLCARELSLQPTGELQAHFLDVGQGDSILLVSPSGKVILTDGGPDLSTLEHLGAYLPFLKRDIDLLILTHPDADHLTALPEVLRRYTVRNVLLSAPVHHSSRYRDFLHELETQDIRIIPADPQLDIDLGDGNLLYIVWPPLDVFGTDAWDSNDASVVVRVLYEDQSILLSGDVETRAENAILRSGADIASGIMTVPHHGSRTSSSTGFILSVHPILGIISAGRGNSFGHPHRDVVDRYGEFGVKLQSTQSGSVSL